MDTNQIAATPMSKTPKPSAAWPNITSCSMSSTLSHSFSLHLLHTDHPLDDHQQPISSPTVGDPALEDRVGEETAVVRTIQDVVG